MNILVTGANGYLGQGIVSSILDRGHDVIAVDFNVDRVDSRAEKKKTVICLKLRILIISLVSQMFYFI